MIAYKSSISLGLVLIPIKLYKSTIDNDIHFNQLDKESKARIKYKKYCSHCGKEVTLSDIIKGYEYEKGKYVVITEEELEHIKTKKDKTIHIIQFAKMNEIDIIYFERNYYAIPDTNSEKSYELLREVLLAQKKVAIAKTVMGQTEKLLVLYPTKEALIIKTLYYHDEIAPIPKKISNITFHNSELAMANLLVESMTKPFEPTQFYDEYQARLKAAIIKKIEGKEIVTTEEKNSANYTIKLAEALKKSLQAAEK